MKKLVFAAALAASMLATAADSAEAKPAETAKAAAAKAEKIVPRIASSDSQKADDRKAAMRAQREKFLAERKARQAKMESDVLEAIKKYGLDDEKAKALMADIQKIMMSSRRPMGMPRGPRPTAKPAAK